MAGHIRNICSDFTSSLFGSRHQPCCAGSA
ncbi:hypothetical protein Bhyg_07612 [Pseudolycoriella hygida]|uniref:Uncharacterized protein n=1 Tax=Pseudolycoriella hygida TaxID=35572 RepID=A0A9Q0S2W7_9DIPT|nr:hypothetical protein Bhyg_07612 [Pseudolycoriella hygida]